MAYMNRDDRRASIVEAAVAITLEQGLAAATVRGVAAALGAAPGQIHHHFASADELRAEAFRALWQRTAPDFNARLERMPPRDRLRAALLGDDPEIEALAVRIWNEALVVARQAPCVREAVREAMEQWIAILVAAIQAGQNSGEFVLADLPIEVARRLAALCLGLDIMVGLELPAHSETEVHARIDAAITLECGPRVDSDREEII